MKKVQTTLYVESGHDAEDASVSDLEREAVQPRMLMDVLGMRMSAVVAVVAPMLLTAVLAAGGCSAVDAPPDLPPATKADASVKTSIEKYSARIGASPVMGTGIMQHEGAWNAVCAAERSGGPDNSMQFVMDQTWDEFKQNARGKTGKDMLEYVNFAWNCIRLKNSYEAGDLNPEIEARRKILSSPPMLYSSSFSATQASLAAAKYFTLRDFGWSATDVWIVSASSPSAGGLFFAVIARDKGDKLWALPSKTHAGIMPADSWPQSIHPSATVTSFFAEGVCMDNLVAINRQKIGTHMEGFEGISREIKRQGSTVMPEPFSEKTLVLEPGKPIGWPQSNTSRSETSAGP